ncbi:hypothetical protein D3C75_327490 [compost metagenome]
MVSLPGLINGILLLVIVIAAFAPPPLRGIIICLCSGLALWVTFANYSPWEDTPDIPPQEHPPTFEANDLIERYGVEQTPKNQKIEK